jgi:hypothetical protein
MKRKEKPAGQKGTVENPAPPAAGPDERRLDGAAEHWWTRRDHGQIGAHASQDH